MRRTVATRSISRGLAPMDPEVVGTLVVYSAKQGEVALDGDGATSPFASALLKLSRPQILRFVCSSTSLGMTSLPLLEGNNSHSAMARDQAVKTTSSWWGIPRSGEYTADKTVRSHRVRVENIGAGDPVIARPTNNSSRTSASEHSIGTDTNSIAIKPIRSE
jgi:hypothetical protein